MPTPPVRDLYVAANNKVGLQVTHAKELKLGVSVKSGTSDYRGKMKSDFTACWNMRTLHLALNPWPTDP